MAFILFWLEMKVVNLTGNIEKNTSKNILLAVNTHLFVFMGAIVCKRLQE